MYFIIRNHPTKEYSDPILAAASEENCKSYNFFNCYFYDIYDSMHHEIPVEIHDCVCIQLTHTHTKRMFYHLASS